MIRINDEFSQAHKKKYQNVRVISLIMSPSSTYLQLDMVRKALPNP